MKNFLLLILLLASLLLTACGGATDYELTGTVWKWQSTEMDSGETFGVSDPAQYTVEFLEDGTASIKADCNQVSTSYTVEGSNLTFGIMATTLAMCPEGSLSDVYIAQLSTVNNFSFLKEGGLLLGIVENTGTMSFTE
jgi:heat shock protein HslJ